MKRLALMFAIVCPVLCVAVSLDAAPLELKQVAADAKWLGHVDFDAVRESTVVQKMVKRALAKHEGAEGHLNIATQLIGFDPCKDLFGATFYGREFAPHQGVLILHAKMDQKRLLGWAERIPKLEKSKIGKRDVLSWTHEHHGHKHSVAVASYSDDVLVFASSVDELQSAINVLEGKAKSLSREASLAGNVPPGTTVLFRVEGLSKANLPCKDPLVKQTESYRFVTGEYQGQSFFRSRSVMTGSEVVGQLNRVIDGGRALAEIHLGDNATGKKLVDGLRVKTDDKTLTVLWSGSADDVYATIDLYAKRIEEHLAKMRGKRDWKRAPTDKKKPKLSPEEDF